VSPTPPREAASIRDRARERNRLRKAARLTLDIIYGNEPHEGVLGCLSAIDYRASQLEQFADDPNMTYAACVRRIRRDRMSAHRGVLDGAYVLEMALRGGSPAP
jgi:hypothetical protein